MIPKAEDCDDCTPSYARSLHSQSLASLSFASLPFALTFLVVSTIVLQKLFPLLSAQKPSQDKSSHGLPSLSRNTLVSSSIIQRPTVKQVAAVTFATTIALSAVLTELLLCEISNSFNPAARSLALQITVTSLLFLLIVAIPLLELYSVISSAGWKFTGSDKGRLRLAWVFEILGFTLYLVGFWFIGERLPSTKTTRAGSKDNNSLTEASLERIGFVGISLMALLSGFASVSSLWQTFGAKPRPVSDADISRKQAGLDATNDMLGTKRSRLRALEQKMMDAPSEGFFKRAIGTVRGNADSQELQMLRMEISGLETMAMSLRTSLSMLQSRRTSQHRATTAMGRAFILFSYIFSLYCLYRICTTTLSFLRRSWSPNSSPTGSDPVTNLLALLAKHYDPTIEQQAWSRQISFLLSGFILLASFSAVLQTFHFFTRFTPSILYTAHANLALLVSQVCGMYVISSALLLRSMTPKEVGSVINDALGTGVLEAKWVDRWFEGWFLIAVGLTAVGIWVGRKLGGGEWDDDVWDGDIEMGKRS
jgi:hypothetical protein